jgi:hypothetical protein
MNFLFSVFFGAGVAAFAYTQMGKRAGYSNTGNVWLIVGVVFFIATAIFFTLFTTFFSATK